MTIRLIPPGPALPTQRLEVTGGGFHERDRVRVSVEDADGKRQSPSAFHVGPDGTFEIGARAPAEDGTYTIVTEVRDKKRKAWVEAARSEPFAVEALA